MTATTHAPETVCTALDRRLAMLQEVTGLPVVFGGAVERDGRSEHLVISQLRGTLGTALSGLSVPSGQGLGGLAMVRARPFLVGDYRSNRTITHHFDRQVVEKERITSIFAFPVRANGRVAGVLYGGSRETTPIGEVAVRAAGGVAARVEADLSQDAAPRPGAAPLPGPQALAEVAAVAARLNDPVLRERLLRAHRSLAAAAPEPPVGAPRLAPREQQCLAIAATGASNAEIAAQLGLSPETVKAYLRGAMRRLEVNNRTAAVHVARTAGLI